MSEKPPGSLAAEADTARDRSRERGSGNATIYDVAKLAGVSASTVSRVLSGQKKTTPTTHRRIFAAVEELGVPLQSVRASPADRTDSDPWSGSRRSHQSHLL